MSTSAKRSVLLLVIIVLICTGPLVVAWAFYKNPHWIKKTSNYGNFITPAVRIERNAFAGLDDFSKTHIDEYKGRWVVVQLVKADGCASLCAESLYKTKKIRLMLNKDVLRIRRMLVVSDKITEQQARVWWDNDATLLRVRPRPGLFDQISTIINRPLEPGMVFLMDPLGNLMMWYPPGFDPYEVKEDMKKLLNVSQIG